MESIKIDVGALIIREIGIRTKQHATLLPLPYLMTTLYKAVKVLTMLHFDRTGNELKDIDIMCISDALSPPEV